MEHTPSAIAAELAEVLTALASIWNRRPVSARNVNSWYEQRAITKFPEPVGVRDSGKRGNPPRVWNVNAVIDWWLGWTPRTGGAPPGNRNALQHGRYIGARAKREHARQQAG